ncbi:MAG: hypothetical protein NZM25_01235 [Leptospiraceae bacterium]|nr:hypothetical protein [Leptospiraceae bacterium]MDW8306348.1 hypothetical protein [Leptospiraceae bacterium]
MRSALLLSLSITVALYPTKETVTEPPKEELWIPVIMDIALPGYGAFSQKEYLWGGLYLAAKLSGFYFLYISYHTYRYRDSLARAAELRQSEEYDRLFFLDPAGNFKTAQDLRNEAQSSYTLFLYAILWEVLIYSISAYHTYRLYYLAELNQSFRHNIKNENGNIHYDLGWQIRF